MEIRIESQENGMAEIRVEFPGQALTEAVDRAYDRHKDDEGFQLPRAGIDRDPVGVPLMQEAVQALFSAAYQDVMREIDLEVASEPKVAVVRADEETGAEFRMTFALRPKLRLGRYKGIHVRMPEVTPTEAEFQEAIEQVESGGQTLDDMQKMQLREAVAERKRQIADQEIEDQVLGVILAEAEVSLPEAMVESEAAICVEQFAAELSTRGMTLQQFCEENGKTYESVRREMFPLAERRIRLRLVLSAIAEAEGIKAEEAELSSAWEQMAAQYGLSPEQLREYASAEMESELRAEIVSQKAYALLRGSTILERGDEA